MGRRTLTEKTFVLINLDALSLPAERIALADQSGYPRKGEGADTYWQIALDPERMKEDICHPLTHTTLERIRAQGAQPIIYTSRLTTRSLLLATNAWLTQHQLPFDVILDAMKPERSRFRETSHWVAWKVMGWILEGYRRLQFLPDQVFIIEPTHEIRAQILASWDVARVKGVTLDVFDSLDDFAQELQGTSDEAFSLGDLEDQPF